MKKRALLTVLCAILLVVATIMGTMAYLTDTKEVKNTFTVGKVYIDLNETDVDENGVVIPSASPVKENSYKLLPGHTYTKDPTVTVLADSEDCYVKMTMSIDKIDKIDAIFATSKEGKADLTAIFTGYNADWELKSTTDKDNVLLGFKGGPSGLLEDSYIEFDDAYIDQYRNTGGFDIIGSGRTKLETEEQFAVVAEVCKKHGVTAVVIIGGDDSNTNAAVLAEYFAAHNTGIQVIGCPKTIDGDLKNEDIECSFGFDTATKTYSEIIGNIARDANSAKKYWHFIKVMGRSASHVALECALMTQPNICLIGEEVAAKKMSLAQIADYIADSVANRAAKGCNFGIAIIPEGIVEFVPEFSVLIAEINELLAGEKADAFNALPTWKEKYAFIENGLTKESMAVFAILPESIQQQLFLERDPHGNVQVSLIESEKLFSALVKDNLAARKAAGTYKGKFSPLHHFLGYEGRCAFPSNFDADYCYSLGYNAFMLIQYGYTGYLSKISNLHKPAEEWVAGGMPITKMMNIERRHGADKPVIRKALVELDGAPFKFFAANREQWAIETAFVYPGAIQYFGPSEVCDTTTRTLALEKA